MRLEQYTQPFASSFYKKYLGDGLPYLLSFIMTGIKRHLIIGSMKLTLVNIKELNLVEIVTNYMNQFGISETAHKHLNELEDNGVVVIGGQQAGLLTGPMYSIHKAISVIALAKQQREILGVPVIPVFWIAGEDHDIDEINHVYIERGRKLQKAAYPRATRSEKNCIRIRFRKRFNGILFRRSYLKACQKLFIQKKSMKR